MQKYKFAMEYLKTIVGILVGVLVIWSQVAERRAKQRRQAEAQRRRAEEQRRETMAQWSAMEEETSMQRASEYEPLPHDNFRPVAIPAMPEEGERSTADIPPSPIQTMQEEPSVDVERWRRAVIDSEILKTKF